MIPDVNVSEATRAVLRADLTLRVLLKTKYHRESRHSKVVIAWAQSRAEKLTQAMLENIQEPAAGFTVELKMVELLGLRDRALICFDMFQDGCKASVQSKDEHSLEGPVHMAVQRGKALFVHKSDSKVERLVAESYNHFRELDKGPLPYFSDLRNPPVYDRGVRLERAEGADSDEGLYASSSGEEEGGDGDSNVKGDGRKAEGCHEEAGRNDGEADHHEKETGRDDKAGGHNDKEAEDKDGEAKGSREETYRDPI